jgi:geranylgeranyl diphosphate synthase type I
LIQQPPSQDRGQAFARYRQELDGLLRASIPEGRTAPELYAILRYHMGWLDENFRPIAARGGKLLRSTMCLLACEAAGGHYQQALPAAASLELLHNFSLIHDDVEDRGAERRGRRTVWARWGEPLAVNAGDALLIISELALMRSLEAGLRAETVLAMGRLLNECCLALTEGQHLDLRHEGNLLIGTDDYDRIIRGKTAALLGCSAQLGALAAGASASQADQYRRFGELVGMSFQVQDDLLGIWGVPSETGKPKAADVFGRKVTLPVIDALERAPTAIRARLAAVYGGATPNVADVDEVIGYLNDLGVRGRAEKRGAAYLDQAIAELDGAISNQDAGHELLALARSLIGRKS